VTSGAGSESRFRPAVASDVDALLRLQAAYYADDGYPFVEVEARACWQGLLDEPHYGRAWVAAHDDRLVGYAVLTFGYSLEYRGRDAFVDELYVAPEWRGQGLAREALSVIEAACLEADVRALHLEVERDKETARGLYRRWGFVEHDRVLMTKPIGR
jgi:GNAT superfamily N-acetyltransferase